MCRKDNSVEDTSRGWLWTPCVLLLLTPPLLYPSILHGQATRGGISQLIAFAIIFMAVSSKGFSVRYLRQLRLGPILLPGCFLIAWWAISYFSLPTDLPSKLYHLSLLELLRISLVLFVIVATAALTRPVHPAVICSSVIACVTVGGITACVDAAASGFAPARGAFGHKELLGHFLSMATVASYAITTSPLERDCPRWVRLAYTPATVVGGLGVILTQNVTSILATLVGVALVTFLRRTSDYRLPSLKAMAWCISGFLIAISAAILLKPKSLLFRAEKHWWPAWQLFIEKPLTGHGIGTFPYMAGAVINDSSVPAADRIAREGASLASLAHSEPLQILAETGIIGLTLATMTVIGAVWVLLRHFHNGQPARKQMALAGLVVLVTAGVESMSNPALRLMQIALPVSVLIGIGVANHCSPHR